jgi:hypothetical protein
VACHLLTIFKSDLYLQERVSGRKENHPRDLGRIEALETTTEDW